MRCEGRGVGAGSFSVPGFYDAMRHAAAATREMVVAAADRHLNGRADEFSVADSKVIHSPTARHFTFGQLAADAAKEQVPMKPRLRPRSELRLIGRNRNEAPTSRW